LGLCLPAGKLARERFTQKFDEMLACSIDQIEQPLRWSLDLVASRLKDPCVDWVKLADDLSIWERESTRLQWAETFLNEQRGNP
jgi:hypothetical protein